jgi:hypothetical protein
VRLLVRARLPGDEQDRLRVLGLLAVLRRGLDPAHLVAVVVDLHRVEVDLVGAVGDRADGDRQLDVLLPGDRATGPRDALDVAGVVLLDGGGPPLGCPGLDIAERGRVREHQLDADRARVVALVRDGQGRVDRPVTADLPLALDLDVRERRPGTERDHTGDQGTGDQQLADHVVPLSNGATNGSGPWWTPSPTRPRRRRR